MKTPIAVVLIVMGSLLIMTPPLHGYLASRNVIALMSARPDLNSVAATYAMSNEMNWLESVACWVTGGGMVGLAIIRSVAGGPKSSIAP